MCRRGVEIRKKTESYPLHISGRRIELAAPKISARNNILRFACTTCETFRKKTLNNTKNTDDQQEFIRARNPRTWGKPSPVKDQGFTTQRGPAGNKRQLGIQAHEALFREPTPATLATFLR